jgi:cytosine/adenosine deaminase-related metal-dependent hydrolase
LSYNKEEGRPPGRDPANAQRREIPDGAVFIRNGIIEAVGPTAELPDTADEVIDLRGRIVLPGLVNTHHHMYQSLTRAVPGAQDAELFGWLRRLYPMWAGLTPEMIRASTLTAMAELILSGCTTSSDHLYIYPNGSRLDDSIEAAQEIGMRFHACRGSMSVGRKAGGLPPDHGWWKTKPPSWPTAGLVRGQLLHFLDTHADPGPADDPAAWEFFDDGGLWIADGHIRAAGPWAALRAALPPGVRDAATLHDYRGHWCCPASWTATCTTPRPA